MFLTEEQIKENLKKFNVYDLDESIKNDKTFMYKGFQCEVKRVSYSNYHTFREALQDKESYGRLETDMLTLWYCGYIYVPTSYFNNIKDENLEDFCEGNIECHGGVTYFQEETNNEGIDCFKIGFDCMHFPDYTKPFSTPEFSIGQQIWNFENVSNEIKHMAEQVIKLGD